MFRIVGYLLPAVNINASAGNGAAASGIATLLQPLAALADILKLTYSSSAWSEHFTREARSVRHVYLSSQAHLGGSWVRRLPTGSRACALGASTQEQTITKHGYSRHTCNLVFKLPPQAQCPGKLPRSHQFCNNYWQVKQHSQCTYSIASQWQVPSRYPQQLLW